MAQAWYAPGGTNQEFPFETPEETGLREIREEVRDDIEIYEYVVFDESPQPDGHKRYSLLIIEVGGFPELGEKTLNYEYNTERVATDSLRGCWIEVNQKLFTLFKGPRGAIMTKALGMLAYIDPEFRNDYCGDVKIFTDLEKAL